MKSEQLDEFVAELNAAWGRQVKRAAGLGIVFGFALGFLACFFGSKL